MTADGSAHHVASSSCDLPVNPARRWRARYVVPGGRLRDFRPVQPAVDFGAHDRAVGRGVVEPAPQRGRHQPAGVLELGDLLIEGGKALAGDRLPLGDRGGMQDAVDLIEGQADVLHHADEDQTAQRFGPVPALPRLARVGAEQAASLVVAEGGGGDMGRWATPPIVISSGIQPLDLKPGSNCQCRVMTTRLGRRCTNLVADGTGWLSSPQALSSGGPMCPRPDLARGASSCTATSRLGPRAKTASWSRPPICSAPTADTPLGNACVGRSGTVITGQCGAILLPPRWP
jgi:hypothetical protein